MIRERTNVLAYVPGVDSRLIHEDRAQNDQTSLFLGALSGYPACEEDKDIPV